MANANLFQTTRGRLTPTADTVNDAGGVAYSFKDEHALAQYAVTGTFNTTFYVGAQTQLEQVLALTSKVSPEFLAKCAIYARKQGYMKDVLAFLLAALAVRDVDLLKKVFPIVIDNGKMLRNFVQIIRSGATGRKSFGTAVKKCIQRWLENRRDDSLFADSVGNTPSLADIIKMVHPKPKDATRAALYRYLIGKDVDTSALPTIVQQYENYKSTKSGEVPNVPFQMLDSLGLGTDEWVQIARNAPWHMTRMNLNTFQRHGVFQVEGMDQIVADRLRDREVIQKVRVFPYQLLSSYLNTSDNLPFKVREALQDAMEIALDNVPEVDGQVYVLPDVSGSMSFPVTGVRAGATSKVRCVDVAALVASAFMRKNPETKVLPFEWNVVDLRLNPRDSVMTNAQKIASVGGGGTNCSAPLAALNRAQAKGALVIYVSDNESWMDSGRFAYGRAGYGSYHRGTSTMEQWNLFKQRNPDAKLVCIDILPNKTTQAQERDDIMNVGGFSDDVFKIIAEFAQGTLTPAHWVGKINDIQIG